MKNLLTTLACALLLSVAASAQVSDYSQLRTNSWSLYGLGGISAATGNRLMENISPSPDTYVAPMVGAGVTYNVRPWLRFNLGYEGSKYRREQRFSEVQADGLSYRGLEVLYNDVELNGEFNLAQIFRPKGKSGRFNVYLGSGIGEMFAYGVDYTIKMGEYEVVSGDKYTDNCDFKAWLTAKNDDVEHMSPYIPANLSFEYDVTPRLSLGLRASAKYILNKDAQRLPTVTESVGVVARWNLVGQKQGYVSKKNRIAELQNSLDDALVAGTALAAESDKISNGMNNANDCAESIKDAIKGLEDKLAEWCGGTNDKVNALMEEVRELKASKYVVYFDNASAELSKEAKATIADAAQRLKSEPESMAYITASCSTPASEEYNKALSDRRAEAVRKALVENGVSADQIGEIISLGKEGMTADPSCRRVIIDVR